MLELRRTLKSLRLMKITALIKKLGAQVVRLITIWARQNLQLLSSSKSGWRALVQVMSPLVHVDLKWSEGSGRSVCCLLVNVPNSDSVCFLEKKRLEYYVKNSPRRIRVFKLVKLVLILCLRKMGLFSVHCRHSKKMVVAYKEQKSCSFLYTPCLTDLCMLKGRAYEFLKLSLNCLIL